MNQDDKEKKGHYSMKTRTKFKNYALRFQGNIATQPTLGYQSHPYFVCLSWRSSVQETFNVIPELCIFFISMSPVNDVEKFFVISFGLFKSVLFLMLDLLDITIKDFLIPALILSRSSVDQFLQSIQYLSRVPNQILLEYPKSFSIMSKVYESYLKQSCTFKINLKTINFSNFSVLKKQKKLAQFRYILSSIDSILEIDQAEKMFCMGSELNDLIGCLTVSPLYQLKLNYYLDEVNPIHIPHIIDYLNNFYYYFLNKQIINYNVIIRNCPKKLKFLQLQVEATNEHQMKFRVKRKKTLMAFSYSYFQIIQQYRNNPAQIGIEINLNINDKFLKLDRYNFEEFYFEVSGNLILNNCEQLVKRFTYLKLLKVSIINKGTIQTFQFSSNLRSKLLETLDITFENIKLDFQEYNFKSLRFIKMILINCEFNQDQLREKLETLNQYQREIYMDMTQCLQSFTRDEQRDLIRKLELQGTDVVIKI